MTEARLGQLRRLVVDVPDFPKPGIVFKDLTPIFGDAEAFATLQELLAERVTAYGPVDAVLGMEARGFILGAALAQRMSVGFVPARKPGKLPRATRRETYSLEYGEDALEIHVDSLRPGMRIAIVDDVLATGGTANAAQRLVTGSGALVTVSAFLLELSFLSGRERLDGAIESLLVV